MFTKENGEPLRLAWVTQHHDLLVARSGLPPVGFHGLRHSSATMQIMAGNDLKTVSSNLGHASISMTADVYAVAVESAKREAPKRTGAFISLSGSDSQ